MTHSCKVFIGVVLEHELIDLPLELGTNMDQIALPKLLPDAPPVRPRRQSDDGIRPRSTHARQVNSLKTLRLSRLRCQERVRSTCHVFIIDYYKLIT